MSDSRQDQTRKSYWTFWLFIVRKNPYDNLEYLWATTPNIQILFSQPCSGFQEKIATCVKKNKDN